MVRLLRRGQRDDEDGLDGGGSYQSGMQGFGDILSEGEVLDVMACIKSTWPERLVATRNEINARASACE
ncbi:cytochrome c class I [Citreicella sp. SE45]|nr:cytochrome c class I [Citreicella sp. SE45]